jgi:hypothetical protein
MAPEVAFAAVDDLAGINPIVLSGSSDSLQHRRVYHVYFLKEEVSPVHLIIYAVVKM